MSNNVVPIKRRNPQPYEIKAATKDEGEVWLYDVIGDSWEGTTGKQFADELKGLGELKTLNIYINSVGGSVFDGVAIHNILARHKARKIVNIDGIAASIASVIAMAGDEIRIAANGMMMIHDPWALAIGSATDMRKMADSLDKVRDAILATYVARTSVEESQLVAWMADETWFTAEEAVAFGLADSITNVVEMAAFAGMDLSAYRHAPDELQQAATHEYQARPHSTVATMQMRIQKMRAND